MHGSTHTTGGRVHPTRRAEPLRRRLALFVAAVALGAMGLVWVHTNISGRMQALEQGFAAIRTERFYRGVQMRLELQRLNQRLLEYHLEGKSLQLGRYLDHADALRQWIAGLQDQPSAPEEHAFHSQLLKAFDEYLRHTVDLQKRPGLFGPSRRQVDELHNELERLSAPIESLCGRLIEVQRGEFQNFLSVSQATLDEFQGLIRLSILLLILLSILVVALVYRGMIQPLRLRLSESEATINRQEKLAALGTLAAGVAHEIRNPLTAIKFRLFSLGKAPSLPASNREDLDVIDREIQRLERIVKDFIQFARPSEPEWIQLPAGRILEDIQELMKPELQAASIQLKVAPLREAIWLKTDPQQLKQVMINLIQNAVESMGQEGVITLGLRSGDALLRGVRRPFASFDITDTGRGMTPDVCARLFDPFFTTKEGGTGLGLSIAARIVDKLGGELRFETEENRGTTFSILLPRIRDHEN